MTTSRPELPLEKLLRLDGQVAIVTGGAMGIGRGIAWRLAEAGAAVVIADRNAKAAEVSASAMQEAGWKVASVSCDLASEKDIVGAVRFTVQTYGRADVLVNNAGIYPFKLALDMTAEEWDRVQAVNLRGTFLFSREFTKQVISQGGGGAIVNIGSIDSLHPSSVGLAAYDASKGGMLMFTRNFALEAAPHGIRVNLLAPGGITTEGASAGLTGMTPEQMEGMQKQFLARIPMGRMGAPDDIARVALFLATPAAAYMTGSTVVVDGGRLLT